MSSSFAFKAFWLYRKKNINRNRDIRKAVRSLAKSGVRPSLDTSIAEAELSKARLTYIDLDYQYKKVQMQLSSLSGIPYSEIVPDTASQQGILEHLELTNATVKDTAEHPVIGYYQALYQSSLSKEQVIKNQYNPRVFFEAAAWGRGASVDGSDHFNEISSGWGFDRNNYLVGIGLSYNLSDLRRKQLKLRTQKAATEYARKQLDDQKNTLELSKAQSDLDVSSAKLRLAEIAKQLKAAQAGYRQSLSLFSSGLTNINNLDVALSALYRAETDYAQANSGLLTALFQKAVTQNQIDSLIGRLN